jgi:hypothetical protein
MLQIEDGHTASARCEDSAVASTSHTVLVSWIVLGCPETSSAWTHMCGMQRNQPSFYTDLMPNFSWMPPKPSRHSQEAGYIVTMINPLVDRV